MAFCIVTALGCLVVPVAAQDDSELLRELRTCKEIADDEQRLGCYDMLGNVPSQEPAPAGTMENPSFAVTPDPVAGSPVAAAAATENAIAAATPAPAAAAREPEYAALTDDIGKRSADEAKRPIRATVTGCSKNDSGDFFFHFENGQIWKYKGERRLRYKDCGFDATITRDFFGYKMQPEGEDRTLRISRVD